MRINDLMFLLSRTVCISGISYLIKAKFTDSEKILNIGLGVLSALIDIAIDLPYTPLIYVFLYWYLYAKKPTIGHSVRKNDGRIIKYYHQQDKRWANIKYGRGNIGSNGCVPAVMAMILSTAEPDITPTETAQWAVEHNFANIGTPISYCIEYAKSIGLNSYYIRRNDDKLIVSALKNNEMVCILTPNSFAFLCKLLKLPIAHMICAYDIDDNNNVRIFDPSDFSRSKIKLKNILKKVSKLPDGWKSPFVSVCTQKLG